MGIEPDPDEQALREQALKLLDQHGQDFALGRAEGQALDLPAALSTGRKRRPHPGLT